MTTPVVVGVALSSRPWRGALQRHCRDHVADVVVVLLRESSEAIERDLDVVLVDDDTSWLSAPFVTRAREAGLAVVGLYDPLEADGHGERHLQRLGVDAATPATVAIDDLLDLVRTLRPDADLHARFGAVASAEGERIPVPRRQVLAVGGPAGAGATEVSIAVAKLWPMGRPILVDVDETHPSLARRLGLALHPHIVTAVEALRGESVGLDGQSPPLTDCLAPTAVGSRPLPFDVIVGLATRDDWSLLRADDVCDLVAELAARWPVVIARLGPQLEDLSRHVDRFGVSRAVAARAERLIGVCDGSATGLLRFVDWLVDALTVVDDVPIDVLVNRAPRSKVVRAQLVAHLREIAGDRVGEIVVARTDRRVERAAWDADLARGGHFDRAVGSLVEVAATHEPAAVEGAAA